MPRFDRRQVLVSAAGLLALATEDRKIRASSSVSFEGIEINPRILAGYQHAMAELIQVHAVGPTETQVSNAIDWCHLFTSAAAAAGFTAKVNEMMGPGNPNGLGAPATAEAISRVQGELDRIGIALTTAQVASMLKFNFATAASTSQALGGFGGLMTYYASKMLPKLYPATSSDLAEARRSAATFGFDRMRLLVSPGCTGASQAINLFGAISAGLAIPIFFGCFICAALVVSTTPALAVAEIYAVVNKC